MFSAAKRKQIDKLAKELDLLAESLRDKADDSDNWGTYGDTICNLERAAASLSYLLSQTATN